jgi:hypothetical protein
MTALTPRLQALRGRQMRTTPVTRPPDRCLTKDQGGATTKTKDRVRGRRRGGGGRGFWQRAGPTTCPQPRRGGAAIMNMASSPPSSISQTIAAAPAPPSSLCGTTLHLAAATRKPFVQLGPLLTPCPDSAWTNNNSAPKMKITAVSWALLPYPPSSTSADRASLTYCTSP